MYLFKLTLTRERLLNLTTVHNLVLFDVLKQFRSLVLFSNKTDVGVTVVSTRAFHLCDPGSIPAQCSYQIKIPPWSHVRRVFPV